MIVLEAVRKLFHQGRPNEVVAVKDVNLTLECGKVSVLTGPSGSGKSTLLSLIGCLARPTSGRISWHGEPLSGLPEPFMAAIRRRTFGFAFQRFNLIQGLSVLDNVMLPAYPGGIAHATLRKRAEDVLASLDMVHRAAAPVELLSGGEMQRVAVARALINDPAIIIADEPTANLDSALCAQFLAIVARLRSEGKTIIMSSHDARICQHAGIDRVIAMRDGGIEAVDA